jgi:hypothetical protein
MITFAWKYNKNKVECGLNRLENKVICFSIYHPGIKQHQIYGIEKSDRHILNKPQ